MLPSMVSYNTNMNTEDMDDSDDLALGAAELADDALSESSFEFDPNALLSAPLDSDDELECIRSSSELNFDNLEGQQSGFAANNTGFDQQRRTSESSTMFLDSNGFPVEAPKVKSKRRPIPEDQRPRRIPGLVKQGSSKSNLLSRSSRASRSLQVDSPCGNSGMTASFGNTQGSNFVDTNMDMTPMDVYSTTTPSSSNMDVNMNTSPHDMDITMTPEPETLQVPGNDLRSYNDAMEKLCESMKRSAMSRNLVKELSNQSLQKDNSSRSLGSGSAQSINVVSRNSSARSLGGSVRSLDGNGFGPLSPGAYPSSRHAAAARHHGHSHSHHHRSRAAPSANGRGVFRHNSSSAVHGNRPRMSNSSNMNQYDDSTLGLVFDGKNMYSR